MTKTIKSLYFFCLGVFVYVPFHAFISTFTISVLGDILPIKGIKDFAVLLAATPLIYVLYKYRYKLRSINFKKPYLIFIAALFFITIITLSTYSQPYLQTIAGYITNYRYYVFFVICIGVAIIYSKNIKNLDLDKVVKIVLIANFVVIGFGFLQVFLLPKDFLSYFGYNETTIKPFQTIDNNESFIRILSTLRGPNPLGAYLAMMAPLAIYYFKKLKTNKILIGSVYSICFLATVYGSQSRSAWVGLVAGLLTYTFITLKNKKLFSLAAGVIIVFASLLYVFRDSNFIQNTVFHTDPNEASSIDSDDKRLETLSYAIEQVSEKPFGHGVGSSGPASNYGTNPVIIENYYLDMAYQIGWLGLIIYLGVIGSVGYALLKQKTQLSYAVFSGFMSVAVVAMFWPVWTDETIALTWWGLAGLVLSSDIVRKAKKG